jgi:protein arginine N-methyltransferase 1
VPSSAGHPLDVRLLAMHQAMLGDAARVEAYGRALRQTVRAGDIVLDVGAGMLALSLLALRHGARHVYAVEADPQAAAIAARIAEDNGLQGRLTVVAGDARTVRLPQQADLLVSEMMGNLGPEEEMAAVVAQAARANLRLGGQIVPTHLTTHLQAVQLDREGWGIWDEDFAGWSLAAVREAAHPSPQLHFFSRPPRHLSDAVPVSQQRLGELPASLGGSCELEICAAGRLHAVAGFFKATLAPGIVLSNFPSYAGCNWAVVVWPLRHVNVEPGDVLRVQLDVPRRIRLATEWQLQCELRRGHSP